MGMGSVLQDHRFCRLEGRWRILEIGREVLRGKIAFSSGTRLDIPLAMGVDLCVFSQIAVHKEMCFWIWNRKISTQSWTERLEYRLGWLAFAACRHFWSMTNQEAELSELARE